MTGNVRGPRHIEYTFPKCSCRSISGLLRPPRPSDDPLLSCPHRVNFLSSGRESHDQLAYELRMHFELPSPGPNSVESARFKQRAKRCFESG